MLTISLVAGLVLVVAAKLFFKAIHWLIILFLIIIFVAALAMNGVSHH